MDSISVHAADADKRAVGRLLRVALTGSVALAVVLLVLLALATGNTGLLEQRYPDLLTLTLAVAGALAILVLELLRRLITRYRRGLFGTRLMARMALSFTIMTVLPVALFYLVSVQFIGRSVESWFAVPVERALESGLSLGRITLEAQLSDLTQRARAISRALSDTSPNAWSGLLNRLREQLDVEEALVVSGSRNVVVTAGGRLSALIPDLPPAAALRQARLTRLYSVIETGAQAGSRSMLLRVIVPIEAEGQRLEEGAFLQLVQAVPTAIAEQAEAVEQGRRDFQALSLSRSGLNRLFSVTLTLIFLLTVFAAIAAAFLLSGWLTGPLSMLAAGTRAVAEGDYRPVKDYSGRDELGLLTQSFNVMTRQLEDARLQVQRNQQALAEANARLASVLSNLSAAVLVLDDHWRLILANPGAQTLLGAPASNLLRIPLGELPRLQAVAADIRAAFDEQKAGGEASWQRQLVLKRADATEPVPGAVGATGLGEQTVLARGTVLPGQGFIVVFDDVTEVVSAQRTIAWAEVARRLAHEIKNPLTPIQLAAERLRYKLSDRLQGADAELLAKGAQTIINQVGALKHMVDEFRDYARLPPARLGPLDLNALVAEVLALYGTGERRQSLHALLEEGLPLIMGDATQLRQVVHNLIGNALEATEKLARPRIELITDTVELVAGARAVRLIVRDNGGGFHPAMLARAFEPYVTNKPRGTGLGLAIVRKIAEEHGARIEVNNLGDAGAAPEGAQVSLLFTKVLKSEENS
jgi:nitrogen fixation/metabolism regulation signal transduction histidine kinase